MLFQNSIGIDIQPERIAVAYLQSSLRGVRLKDHVVEEIGPGMSASDRQAKMAAAIEAFCTGNRIVSADLFITLSSRLIMVREIRLPAAVKENLRETLYYEMEKYVPVPADKLYFDYQITHEDKPQQQITVFLVAVSKEVVDAIVQMISGLGIGISGIEPRFTALANYYTFDPAIRQLPDAAFFWADDAACEIALSSHQRLTQCRRFDVPGSNGDELAAVHHWIEAARAEKDGNTQPVPLAIVHSAGSHPVVRHLVDRQQVHVVAARIPMAEPVSDRAIIAIGAALKGVRRPRMNVNVLPEKLRKPQSRLALYVLLSLTVLTLFSAVVWAGSWIAANRQFVNGLDSRLDQLKQEVGAVQEMQDRAGQIERRISAINAIKSQQISVLAVARELSREIPADTWLRSLTLKDDNLRLEGYAESASALVTILEQLPIFSDVGFLSPITIDKNGKERFSIGLKVLR